MDYVGTVKISCVLLPMLALPVSRQIVNVALPSATGVPITLGQSVVVLNGPWKFHTGDDPHWAEPTVDDSDWESVDLTPATGAHDADVGLTGYVVGWTAKGHAGYWGYAWYRISVSVNAPPGWPLALAGPPDVDDAYQVFFNGRLLGSAGRFSTSTPVIYSIQPRTFPLPKFGGFKGANDAANVIAFRVWVSPGTVSDSPDAGGIHIAPALGETSAIEARYRLQWLETVCGYVVDAVEPILFLLLAIMAGSLIAFERSDKSYLWLVGALLLTALVRANQVLFFWTQYESIWTTVVVKNVVLVPLVLGAWTMAWRAWFGLERPPRVAKMVGAFTLLYMGSQILTLESLSSITSHRFSFAVHIISSCLRLSFLGLLIHIVYGGVRKHGREGWLAVPAIVLVSVGLFAQELSTLHVPGIWFPYGTGVSRTQFAYAAFDVALFGLLLRRLLLFAQRFRHLALELKHAE